VSLRSPNNMSKKLNTLFSLGVALAGFSLFLFSSSGLMAQTNYTWNNSASGWTTTTAWNPTGGPQTSATTGNTNVAIFASVGAGNNSVDLTSARTVYGLVFTNGANAYTFSTTSAKVLDIMGSLNGSSALGLINQSGANQTFSLAVANTGNDSTWRTDIGSTTTLNGALSLTTGSSSVNRNLYLSGAGNWNVGGAIGNGGTATNGTVSITATGTTTFSGNNTYDGRTTMNATGGTLTLSGDNSGAAGGMRVFAGTVNVNNANALGTGTLTLDGAGTTINNTSGAAVTNLGNNAVVWDGNLGTGFTFGTSASTSGNYNLNLGTGTVTAASARTMTFAGSGTTLAMGTLDSTTTSATAITFTINGAGNTLTLGGYKIRSLAPSSLTAVSDSLAGTANLTINGAIIDGNAYANGLKIKGTGTTTFSGNNTYTGVTDVTSGAYLKLGSSTALGSTLGATSVSSGGLLDLNGQTIAETLNYTGTGGLLNSAAGAATVSGVVDIASGMTVNTTGDITLSGKLTGSSNKNLIKSGAGTLKFSAGNSDFAGTSTVSGGTLLVTSAGNVSTSSSIVDGGTLRVNGTAGGVTVNVGGSLGGSGTVGAVTLNTGAFLKPGNSPGILTAGSSIWKDGSTYNWEIDSNASTAAAGTNWDLFSVTGTLDMSALSSTTTMNLVLASLSGFDLTSSTNRNWVIARASSLLGTGGAALSAGDNVSDYFNINATAFVAGTPSLVTEWRVEVGTTGSGSSTLQTLNLMAIPEPSTSSMLAFGLGGLVLTRLLRRKQS
jgi:autotransporter-associated beta strand protein